MPPQLQENPLPVDVTRIQKIPIIATILDVIGRSTGMGFVAVARVTDAHWITCSVLDNIQFGLQPGDELELHTTICNEIRQSKQAVVIDHVDLDAVYCQHHTPLKYGFQSYISMPILRQDGSFFGTLCAIDPHPKRLNTPEIIGMFELFSELITFHLDGIEKLESSEAKLAAEREARANELQNKNAELQKMNKELASFAYVASHDLQEPLRKIYTFANLIQHRDYQFLSEDGKNNFNRLSKAVTRMQALIQDLLVFAQVEAQNRTFEYISLSKVVEAVRQNYSEELSQKQVLFEAAELCEAYIIPFQFSQLLQNLISNSLKFARQGTALEIRISSTLEKGDKTISEQLSPEFQYCHLIYSDNGIGFEPQYNHKVFEVFQRLNGRSEYEGTGIGLSIVKKIVEIHKGFIKASGEVNKGVRFDIYIPHDDNGSLIVGV